MLPLLLRESPTTPVGAGMKFQCSDEQGAFVFMNVPAEKSHILASHSLAPFIRHNIDLWADFAQSEHDLQIARDQLIFVSGVVKTEDWGLGAFTSHAKGGEVAFNAQGPFPFFQGTFSVQAHRAQTGNIQYRAKPLARSSDRDARSSSSIRSPRPSISSEGAVASPSEDSASASAERLVSPGLASTSSLATPPKRDQTLFIHYYKMKARWWMKRIVKAAAGPDDHDADRSGDGEDVAAGLQADSDDGEVVQEPPVDQVRCVCVRREERGVREVALLRWVFVLVGVRPCGLPAGLHLGLSVGGQRSGFLGLWLRGADVFGACRMARRCRWRSRVICIYMRFS